MSTEQPMPNRQSLRLKWFDYSSVRPYMITICVADRVRAFGTIEHARMCLNTSGKIAEEEWNKLSERFPSLKLDHYVFMPNHMHGILLIHTKTNIQDLPERFQEQRQSLAQEESPALRNPYTAPSLGDIICTYKAATTYRVRLMGAQDFAWHRNYWETIIRGETHLYNARQYISHNPERWGKDKFYTT